MNPFARSYDDPGDGSGDAPIVLERRGVFFVDGRHAPRHPSGTCTVGQMHVAYEIPWHDRRRDVPIVLLPGGCHSGAAYDETPDGREGWRTLFLRAGFPVYSVEWVGRGPSGFDPSAIHHAKDTGDLDEIPIFLHLSHEFAWTAFRFGPEPGVAYPGLRFPLHALDHYLAQLLPNTEMLLDEPDLATADALLALLERIGPAIVVGHSRAGRATLPAAIRRPDRFAALVSLDTVACRDDVADADVPALARVPFLSIFGDYLDGTGWRAAADEHRELVARLADAGGTARHVELPEVGVRGNSHMLMMEDNSAELAAMLVGWFEASVAGAGVPAGAGGRRSWGAGRL